MADPLERAARACHSRFLLVVISVLVCLVLAVPGAWAADAKIGLYQDESGNSCSFSNPTGFMTAYVVVTPGTGGTLGVRFSAPVPSCFDATYIGETIPLLIVGIGSSPTGISLTPRDCQTTPFNVLAITYLSNGGTTPCCEFPILADPFTGTLEAVNCSFDPQPITTNVAHFNGDASCPCGVAPPPSVPINPVPSDLSTGIPLNQALAWQMSGQPGTYNVYFGAGSGSPPLVASGLTSPTYSPGALQAGITYRWRIVAIFPGSSQSGPEWSFTTDVGGDWIPCCPSPSHNAVNVPVTATLYWATPPHGLPLTFDVYFGTDDPPPLVATNVAGYNYNPGVLSPSSGYFWRIVARDPFGAEKTSPIWFFRTNNPTNTGAPAVPSNPSPPNNGYAGGYSPTLSWTCSDPDGQPLTYTVILSLYPSIFPFVNIGSSSFPEINFGILQHGTRYYWQVHASDGTYSTAGPVWTFFVTGGQTPVAFTRFDATSSGNAVNVRWELASDEAMSNFTLYRRDGTSTVAIVAAEGAVVGTTGSYVDAAVEAGKTYHYELLVRTVDGDEFRSQVATVALAQLALTLHQNVPNPFNPQTTIRYELPSAAHVQLSIFDVNGRLVRTLVNEQQTPGSREATWTGRDDAGAAVSSGVYFYVLEAGKERLTRKLVLLK